MVYLQSKNNTFDMLVMFCILLFYETEEHLTKAFSKIVGEKQKQWSAWNVNWLW